MIITKNKNAICFIFDNNYLSQGKHAILSAKKYNPNHSIVLLTDKPTGLDIIDIEIIYTALDLDQKNWLTIGRVAIVEYIIKKLDFETVIFIDGDTYSYSGYDELQEEINKHSIVVIPHITKPLPDDGKYPQNRIISLSGNYNTGIWAASKNGLDFIQWWKKVTTLFPITNVGAGLVNEQGWLRFAGDFDDNIKIFRHPGFNVAYWNIKQRILQKKDNIYYIDDKKLSVMHFSGFKKELNPSQMSIFQNRYFLDKNDLAYEIYNNYHKLIWS